MIVRADLWFFVFMLTAAFVLGTVCGFLFRSSKRPAEAPAASEDALYLIISHISHRLKTSVEVIRGHWHGFDDSPPQDAERWGVARRAVGNEGDEIEALTHRLDLIVRLGLTGQPLIMEPVNLPALLEDVTIALMPAAEVKGIRLGGVVRAGDGPMPYVSGDRAALREIFANILENAVQHNPPGAEISVEVRAVRNGVEVSVYDNGAGFPPELAQGPAQRGNRRYSPGQARGSGMGLYLCKLLAELHGGTITLNTAEGRGASLRVSLPLRRA